MQGADKTEKQCPMTEGCQEQNQVEALLRQLKAVEKENSRLKAVEKENRRLRVAGRVQRRYAKKQRLYRAHERTHKYDLHRYDDEAEWDLTEHALQKLPPSRSNPVDGSNKKNAGFGMLLPSDILEEEYSREETAPYYYDWLYPSYRMEKELPPPSGAMLRELQGDPWQDIDKQGWKTLAIYRNRKHRFVDYGWPYDREGGGRFFAYNVHRQVVLLSEFSSGGGCSTCGNGELESNDAMMDILDGGDGLLRPFPVLTSPGKPFEASAEDFLTFAQRLTDPAMKLRRALPEDEGYRSLTTMYATYTLFYSRVLHGLSKEPLDFTSIATWSPLEWTPQRYNAVVRLQAMWRGWLVRQWVFCSPNTELGRRCMSHKPGTRDAAAKPSCGIF